MKTTDYHYVDIYRDGALMLPWDEFLKWCNEQQIGRSHDWDYNTTGVLVFCDAEDAIAFKLRFGL